MFFVKDDICVEFDVVGYQFPNIKTESSNFDYDANWLTIKLVFEKHGYLEEYADEYLSSCILTTELKNFTQQLASVVNGTSQKAQMDNLESKLNIKIEKQNEGYALNLNFIKNAQGERIIQTFVLTQQELENVNKEFCNLVKKFPIKN